MRRVVIAGGSGQVGQVLQRNLKASGYEVVVIGRSVAKAHLRWDAEHLGPWKEAIDGSFAVINLAGRTVNCRYHWENLNEMMNSRVQSALVIGRAISAAKRPPEVWLQASTATIYAHNEGEAYGEEGLIDAQQRGVPPYWGYSVNIARSWELALASCETPHTRKVAMRFGFIMSEDKGGIFDWLMWLVLHGLGGPFYGGQQYVSWIEGQDLAAAVEFLLTEETLSGPVNLTSPHPIPNKALMRILRNTCAAPVGLPIWPGIAEVGAYLLNTDVELMRKSRRVVPTKLLEAGFSFQHPKWTEASSHLFSRWRRSASAEGTSSRPHLEHHSHANVEG